MVHDSTVNTNNKTVVDCKTRPGAAIWGVSAATLCANVTSSIKPEVHNLLQRHQRRTGPRSQVTFTTRCKAKPDCSPPGLSSSPPTNQVLLIGQLIGSQAFSAALALPVVSRHTRTQSCGLKKQKSVYRRVYYIYDGRAHRG